MKKILLIILLCSTKNLFTMVSTTIKLIKKPMSHPPFLAFRFKKITPSDIRKKIIKFEREREFTNSKIKAHQEANKELITLKESYNYLKIALEQQKEKMPLKQYYDMFGKIQESLLNGKMDITHRLTEKLNQIEQTKGIKK